ncbi:MAG: hypothetical protein ACXW18_05960 [Pyrinomonadaceae bacterium]
MKFSIRAASQPSPQPSADIRNKSPELKLQGYFQMLQAGDALDVNCRDVGLVARRHRLSGLTVEG